MRSLPLSVKEQPPYRAADLGLAEQGEGADAIHGGRGVGADKAGAVDRREIRGGAAIAQPVPVTVKDKVTVQAERGKLTAHTFITA